ncbi:rod shape-determining protein MreD [Lutibacter oricola]|uniref:Rod shape-determining protein MreD n=1 Tax=Lutibacter oricola TaxID=762486 RepID=A0A1H3BFD4_9FLAO|nr:rod shape-determining protein MreD [Lutibacter oricola]SDX40495.1 rod shape-determining protein MreD [Lutibacter oricola]
MNKLIFSNTVRFILLILIQVLVLNHINLFGYLNPMPYIVWVLLFPIRKNKTSFLLLSFLLGLTLDFFSNSGGIHAAATLFIAFIRLPLLTIVLRKNDFDYYLFNLRGISFSKAIIFISLLTIIHHFIVFSLVYFNFSEIITILNNTLFTSIFTIILSLLGITLFTNKK